jgi:hypothetical protein
MAVEADHKGKMMALLMVGLLLAAASSVSAKNNVELNRDGESSSGEGRVVYADMRLAVEDKASESSDAHQRQRQNQV